MCCLFTWLPAGMWLYTQVEVLCPPSGTLKGDVWHLRLDFFQMSHNDIHTSHKMTFLLFSMHAQYVFFATRVSAEAVWMKSVVHSAIAPCLSGSIGPTSLNPNFNLKPNGSSDQGAEAWMPKCSQLPVNKANHNFLCSPIKTCFCNCLCCCCFLNCILMKLPSQQHPCSLALAKGRKRLLLAEFAWPKSVKNSIHFIDFVSWI